VPIRTFHTEGFRITAIFVAIFALSAAVLAIVTLQVVDQELRDQIVQFANADIGAVKDGYRTEGVREAREVINQRMASPGASDFFLLQRGASERLAGNLAPMPPRTGILTLSFPGDIAGRTILGVGVFVAPDVYAFSGSDLRNVQMARRRILRTLVWVFASALVLALLGGLIVSRSFLRRTDEITTTCRAIMAGNLTRRIPVRGTEDELDRLSDAINAMLDRIAALMENLKQITNDVAHDLRTPVTHLRHRLERARDQAGSVEDYDRALEAAIAAADDILALFSALLRISKAAPGDPPSPGSTFPAFWHILAMYSAQ
jgi:methyl-accepting chemotaxis protein